MSSKPLPPLAALRAFAAAGRLQSIRDAANELRVTASAVSHHVRTMEDWVGAPLFVRSARQVRLTAIGRRLSDRLDGAFRDIGLALSEAHSRPGPAIIRVSALPLFTSVYLIPRLANFEAHYPGASIMIETGHRIVDFDRDAVDIAIRNVANSTPGLAAYKLMDLRGIPLCSPTLKPALASPPDLARATLIHIASRPNGWAHWLSAQGLNGLAGASNLTVDTLPAALDLAAHGRGVTLGLDPVIWDAPQMDRLVVPFASSAVSAGAYFVVHRRHDRANPAVQAFVRWIRSEVRADAARYARLRSTAETARDAIPPA
jgi:LysR family glycine cleavage system transcriptional activator